MGSYNKKIITSLNSGFMEIWEYDKPIFNRGEKLKDKEASSESFKRRTFEELSDEEQTERLTQMSKVRIKSKWRLMRLIDTNVDKRTSFVTLTVTENIQDREEFMSMVKDFIKRFNYQIYKTKKAELKWIYVIETQRRGAYHAHFLMFNVPYIPHDTLTTLWGNGFVFINRLDTLDDISNTSRYVAKYMEKSLGEELINSFGKKSFFFSRNLKKIDETKFYSEEKLDFDDSTVLYETNYVSKIYDKNKNQMIDNPVKYRKIKLSEGVEGNE
ncbi:MULTISPECIES: rolling circle replication-associated protein [Enterococcus]|uniref:rolling circle replication-associated protein n=1 Tax=Enterococcus TaxID=1350 RepID=UPI000DE92F36|nr:Rep protein [Enterococcus faecalis]EGO8125662.1 Rep protein [Enterococcus faecalis]EGO8371962.1 Rep protein [Enterococcus faecalis]EKG8798455.1 Rep protein [Enterococcus faecalis]EKJ3567719.1 Rep protein [Enterococcus faecalis]MBO6318102.1 Rep protein [Enterococcus faecalis]